MWGWFSSLCRSLFVPFCSSLCFVLWSLSVYSLSIPLFIFLRPCSPRRNKENSLLFWFVLCLRFLPFVSVSWFFFWVLPLFSSSSPLFFSSLCFLFPAVRDLFFRPSWIFFFSLLCFFEKKQRNESLLVALFSSLYYVCSEGEGGGATGDEVGAPVLAGHCASLFFFVSPVFSLSVPLVLFSSSPPLLRSLIFSGFIARECQASLQLKRLQSHYCRNRSCGRRRRRRWLISRNGAVCMMGMAICNLVTEVLKSCNQASG